MTLARWPLAAVFLTVPLLASAAVKVTSSGAPLAERVAAAVRGVDLEPGAQISVTASGGVITLSGWTTTLAARDRAARAAEGVAGVTFSHPNLVARPTGSAGDVAAKVRAALAASGVTADVTGGRARLTGTASSAAQREAAEAAVRDVDGVTNIQNDIRIQAVAGTSPSEPFVPVVREKLSPDDVAVQGTVIVIRGVAHRIAGRRTAADGRSGYLLVE